MRRRALLTTLGAVLDTAQVELDELRQGQKWQFSLVYPGSGDEAAAVADYRLRVETEE